MSIPEWLHERLERLGDDQRVAATAAPGPVLCVAPAGSGKTTTLVARIGWRIANGDDAAQMCAVTFNRRAADELRERVDAALAPAGIVPGTVRVRTFHGLGLEILAEAGLPVDNIVERAVVLQELAGGALPVRALRFLEDAFSRLALDPERGPPPEDAQTHAAWYAYRAALADRNALDLDDLVARPGPTLRADAALLGRWRCRTQILFVDEAQDLDRTQLDLALLLTGERRDIFLVGDDDQTIYAWRLADVRRVLGLAALLPGLRRVDLVVNHRCPPEVVRRAARLVAHGRERFDKRILPSPCASGTLTLAADPGDAVARARHLLGTWQRDGATGLAVLARTNAELAPYAAIALEMEQPYQVDEDGLLLDDPVIDGLLARAMAEAREGESPLLTLGRVLGADGADPPPTADAHPTATGTFAGGATGAPKLSTGMAGASLLSWAAAYATLEELCSAIGAARRTRARLRAASDGIVLATVHGTKGLEFDHVAVIGLDDGVFPSRRSLDEAPDPERALEEERRLAYVAWTRPRRSLTLLYDPAAPSVFLREAFSDAELRA